MGIPVQADAGTRLSLDRRDALAVTAGEWRAARAILDAALRAGEFELRFQPVVDLATGAVSGAEALVRWCAPEGEVLPAGFIPASEASGFIVELGDWVLQEACLAASRWSGGPLGPSVSVNVSPVQLPRVDFVTGVGRALRTANLSPSRLCLELTETALLDDVELLGARLDALRALGVRLALDDFGTGFATLGLLRRFPAIDVLKIDRTFVAGLAESARGEVIVAHMVELAHAMGATATAEGIEEPAQLELVRKLGCDFAQGFLFAPPLEAQSFEAVLTHGLNGFSAFQTTDHLEVAR